MRTTITKKLMGLAFGAFSLTAAAQCPTINSVNLAPATFSAGLVQVTANLSGTVSANNTTYGATGGNGYTSFGGSNSGYIYFPNNGTYTVCAYYSDSTSMCNGSACSVITITNSVNSGTTTPTGNCPTITSLGITYGANGMVNVTANYTGTLSGTGSFNPYVNGFMNSQISYTNFPYSNSGSAWFSNNGSGSFCVTYSDSNNNCYSSLCDSIVVTNAPNSGTTSAVVCPTLTAVNVSYGANGVADISGLVNGDEWLASYNIVSYGGGSVYNYGFIPYGQIQYSATGIYTVCITAIADSSNACGNSSVCGIVNMTTVLDTTNGGSGTGTVTPVCFANSDFYLFADSMNTGNYFAYNNASGSGSLSYLWNFGDGTTSTQVYPFHQYATAGMYTVCLTVTSTDSTGSCSDTYCMMSGFKVSASALMGSLQVKPALTITGVKENNNIVASLNAYPNPMNDELTIEVALTNNSTALVYTIVDALGKVVAQNTMSNKTTINTSSLEKGFYFLSVSTEKGQLLKSTKLVK